MAPNWFIALPVDAGDWLAPLLRSAPRALRAFHPSDLHLTLAFLGGCSEAEALAAWSLAVELPRPSFAVTLGGLAAMGSPKRPSAISAELHHGRDAVARYLGDHRDPLFAAASARPDTRPALPHITVGRPPRDCSDAERASIVAWARATPPIGAALRLDSLALYTWSDDRRAQQFQVVHRL